MSQLFFWLTFYSKIVNVLYVIFGFSLGIAIISWVCYFIGMAEDEEFKEKSKIYVIIFTIIFGVSTIMISVKPTKQEILTYYIIKQVDEYNAKNETSNFNPDNIIKNVDQTINKISDLADNLLNKINNNKEEK